MKKTSVRILVGFIFLVSILSLLSLSFVSGDFIYYVSDCSSCPTSCTAPGVGSCAKEIAFRSNTGIMAFGSYTGLCGTTADCRLNSASAVCGFVRTSPTTNCNACCLDQACVTCGGGCSDECSPSGTKTCKNDTASKTCGNYDADSCLEWSSGTSCSLDKMCFNNDCRVKPSLTGPASCYVNKSCGPINASWLNSSAFYFDYYWRVYLKNGTNTTGDYINLPLGFKDYTYHAAGATINLNPWINFTSQVAHVAVWARVRLTSGGVNSSWGPGLYIPINVTLSPIIPPVSTTPCGNGSIDTSLGEECDGGNNVSGDGCSEICKIEVWTCNRTIDSAPFWDKPNKTSINASLNCTVIPISPDCCPSSQYCDPVDSKCKVPPPANNCSDLKSSTLCKQANKNKTLVKNSFISNPPSFCDEYNCSCEWNSTTSSCIPLSRPKSLGVTDIPSNEDCTRCEIKSILAENNCGKTKDNIVFNYNSYCPVGLISECYANRTLNVPCSEVARLPFFGGLQFMISLLAIALVYAIVIRMKK